MKRRLFVFYFLLCLMEGTYSQTVTVNNLPSDLKGVRMNFQMDFSNAIIFGLKEKEFAEYEKDWYDDKSTVIRNFKSGANLAIGKSYGIGDYKNAQLTIRVNVETITNEGFIICNTDIVNSENEVLFHIDHLTAGKEPAISLGTKLARVKVWATLTGKKLGSILKSELSNK